MIKSCPEIKKKFTVVFINCMETNAGSSKSILDNIYAHLDKNSTKSNNSLSKLNQIFIKKNAKKKYLIILDEVDQLASNQQILYSIFEWPKLEGSNCSVIGIANSLDFTHRFMPLLEVKNYEPQLLSFPPYSVAEIVGILEDKINSLSEINSDFKCEIFFPKIAMELLAKKVASSGDLRKAFDICRLSIERAQHDNNTSSRHCLSDLNSTPSKNSNSIKGVSVSHVVKVLDQAFGTINSNVSKILSLNPQQKFMLVIFFLLQKNSKLNLTVILWWEKYQSVCKKTNLMESISRSEFYDLVISVESLGLLQRVPAKKDVKSTLFMNVFDHSAKSLLNTPKKINPNSSHLIKSKGSGSGSKKITPSKMIIEPTDIISLSLNEKELHQGIQDPIFIKDFLNDGNIG